MPPLRLVFCVLTLTGLGLVMLSNTNTAVALNLLGFTSRSLPLSVWMLLALGVGLGLSLFFEGLFALARWQPRYPRGSRDPEPGPRPRSGYAEDDEFIEENFTVPQRDRYDRTRPDDEAPWDDPSWVADDRAYDSYRDRQDNDRTYDKREYNKRAYGEDYGSSSPYSDRPYDDRPYDDRPAPEPVPAEDDYQARPFKAVPKDRSSGPSTPPVARPDRVYDADFRVLDDNNPREPQRRAQAEPPAAPPRPQTEDRNEWGDWNDNDLDW